MSAKKISLLLLLAALIATFFFLDLGRFLSLAAIKERQTELASLYSTRPFTFASAFFAIYLGATALSLPGAVLLTLASGAIFGLAVGTLLVSFASSAGATLAFLSSRYLLRDLVERRFGSRLVAVNAGIERDGPLYLFSLRLVPLLPFFIVNLVLGLTGMKVSTFYWVSQAGMLAGTLVYVNAGTQLSRIESLSGILSPGLLVSFALLGVFPPAAKWALRAFRQRPSSAAPGTGKARPDDVP